MRSPWPKQTANRSVIPHLMRNPKPLISLDSCFHRNDKTIVAPNLALNWLCFIAAPNRKILHNPLSYRYLSTFKPFENWLCFFKQVQNFPPSRNSTFVIPVKTGIHPPNYELRTLNHKIGFVWLCFITASAHQNLRKLLLILT